MFRERVRNNQQSSAKAEFRALSQEVFELLLLKRLTIDLKISYSTPMKFYSDNKYVISIAQNPVHHDRTKHVEIRCHFIKEKIEEGIISLSHV